MKGDAMRSVLVLSFLSIALLAEARVRLGHPFADNMVLQRGMPVRVWGTADPGEKVTVAKRLKYQKFLVKTLGLEEKCGLIGMSWGGFYSVRYASEHPECVKAMYLDAPLLDFSTLGGFKAKSWKNYVKYWPTISSDYVGKDDPMQPVAPARAEKIAKAKIPVLCIYGGKDGVVPPEKNCLRFAEAYEKAGGHLKLWRDNLRGHHPHGLEPNEQQVFVNFFKAAFGGAK